MKIGKFPRENNVMKIDMLLANEFNEIIITFKIVF